MGSGNTLKTRRKEDMIK